jgi:general secretion pathway protein G
MGEYPASLQGLITAPGGSDNWNGPYLEKGIPKDPWGKDYIYATPGSRNPHSYDLSSSGPPSGKGANEPIGNWE